MQADADAVLNATLKHRTDGPSPRCKNMQADVDRNVEAYARLTPSTNYVSREVSVNVPCGPLAISSSPPQDQFHEQFPLPCPNTNGTMSADCAPQQISGHCIFNLCFDREPLASCSHSTLSGIMTNVSFQIGLFDSIQPDRSAPTPAVARTPRMTPLRNKIHMTTGQVVDVTTKEYWSKVKDMGEGNSVTLLVGSLPRDRYARRSSVWYILLNLRALPYSFRYCLWSMLREIPRDYFPSTVRLTVITELGEETIERWTNISGRIELNKHRRSNQ